MKKEKKYLVELTPTQLLELTEWHKSHLGRYKKMGVKDEYLKLQKEDNLASFIKEAYNLVKDRKDPIHDESDLRISQEAV